MRRLLPSLVVLVLAACSDLTSSNSSAPGTYTLRLMNGQRFPLPVDTAAGFTMHFTDQTLTMNHDGSYSVFNAWQSYSHGAPGTSGRGVFETGTWTEQGSAIIFTHADGPGGSTNRATLRFGRLTVVGYSTLVYMR